MKESQSQKQRREETRAAWDLIVQQPQEVLDAIAVIVDHGKREGDYCWDGEGSTWQESATATLEALAQVFRKMKTIHDPFNVIDPF